MKFDVSQRFDGKFNVWRRQTVFNESYGFSEFWSIIKVFEHERNALLHRNQLMSQYRSVSEEKDREEPLRGTRGRSAWFG